MCECVCMYNVVHECIMQQKVCATESTLFVHNGGGSIKGGATNLTVGGGSMHWNVEGQYSKNTKI